MRRFVEGLHAKSGFRIRVYWNKKAVAGVDLPPKPEGAKRFVCVSDTHGKTEFESPTMPELHFPAEYDYVVHAGDFTGTGTKAQIEKFNEWIGKLKSPAYVIAGNHDVPFDAPYYNDRGAARFHIKPQPGNPRDLLKAPNLHYMEDSGCVTPEGIRLYGSPWQPEFCDWAFNLPRKSEQLRKVWAKIPDDTHVLLTHGPPHGYLGGLCRDGFDAGCEELTEALKRIRPLAHVVGHIHEDYGVFQTREGVLIINACSVDFHYKLVQAPIVFDLIPEKQ